MLKTLIAASLAGFILNSLAQAAAEPVVLQVTLSDDAPLALSGRVIVFAQPWDDAVTANQGQPPTSVDVSERNLSSVAVAAEEIGRIAPGQTRWINADHLAFPTPFSELAPGSYAVQAVLDVNHDYNYFGRSRQEPASPVVRIRGWRERRIARSYFATRRSRRSRFA